ncbi:MAG: GTP cyclohydrolase II [Bryobacter sp.]
MSLNHAAEADFPTEYGAFRIHAFEWTSDGNPEEAVAVTLGNLSGEPPLLRIHSQCLTGDVFHSLRCDCREQLEMALAALAREGRGLIIYEMKEGRGIGIINKLRAYQLQDEGKDTVEANEALGLGVDLRDYRLPGAICRYFGIAAVKLMSNNPDKIAALEQAGVRVAERVPIVAPQSEHAREYLAVKRQKLGHLL